MLAPVASMKNRIAMYNGNALKIGLFGANCSSGRSATKVPERWAATWPECLALARLADEAGLDFMLPIARWKGYGGETDFHGSHAGNHHLGGRTPRRHQAHDRVRHRACAAVPSADRRQGIRHRRPYRPRPHGHEYRLRLERRRIRHVRRQAARARRALRLRAGMGRRRQTGLDARRYVRLRRQVSASEGGARVSEALRRHAPADDERRLVRRRTSVRAAQLRRVLRRHRRLAQIACRQRRQGGGDQGASARSSAARSKCSPSGR